MTISQPPDKSTRQQRRKLEREAAQGTTDLRLAEWIRFGSAVVGSASLIGEIVTKVSLGDKAAVLIVVDAATPDADIVGLLVQAAQDFDDLYANPKWVEYDEDSCEIEGGA